jgi:hypothetical protein
MKEQKNHKIMSKEKIKITQREKEMFDYLNELRDGGQANMFGVSIHMAKKFSIGMEESRKVLSKWMELFDDDGYDDLL